MQIEILASQRKIHRSHSERKNVIIREKFSLILFYFTFFLWEVERKFLKKKKNQIKFLIYRREVRHTLYKPLKTAITLRCTKTLL